MSEHTPAILSVLQWSRASVLDVVHFVRIRIDHFCIHSRFRQNNSKLFEALFPIWFRERSSRFFAQFSSFLTPCIRTIARSFPLFSFLHFDEERNIWNFERNSRWTTCNVASSRRFISFSIVDRLVECFLLLFRKGKRKRLKNDVYVYEKQQRYRVLRTRWIVCVYIYI